MLSLFLFLYKGFPDSSRYPGPRFNDMDTKQGKQSVILKER